MEDDDDELDRFTRDLLFGGLAPSACSPEVSKPASKERFSALSLRSAALIRDLSRSAHRAG